MTGPPTQRASMEYIAGIVAIGLIVLLSLVALIEIIAPKRWEVFDTRTGLTVRRYRLERSAAKHIAKASHLDYAKPGEGYIETNIAHGWTIELPRKPR